MNKVMVFIDFENFNIALMQLYKKQGLTVPRLDYNSLPKEMVELLPGSDNKLVKTFLFAPKPDSFLMKDSRRKSTYDWINSLKTKNTSQ